MIEQEKLFIKKKEIGDERDLCAELYNIWITRLHDSQRDPERYKIYMNMIQMMEPYSQALKEEIRTINRRICELEGVDSIDQTIYMRDCNNKYGKASPNAI